MKLETSLCLATALFIHTASAAPSIPRSTSPFRIDVHSHVIPDFYTDALREAGFPVINGAVTANGSPLPSWSLDTHIKDMDANQVNYSALSLSAPGVSFLAGNETAAIELARQLNLAMYNYTQAYPTRLGALCVLPLPHVDAAVEEARFCLEALKFDGVGIYTNSNGTYLGDRSLDPLFDLLNNRSATLFVHPTAPGCGGAAIGYPPGMSEYTFESVRAMENLLFTGQRRSYGNINIIFPHGGGVMPFVAARIAGQAAVVSKGSINASDTLAQFRGYFFDTASATSAPQLWAVKEFYGGDVSKVLLGTDYPYVHEAQVQAGIKAIEPGGNFSSEEMAMINGRNALSVFPSVVGKLGLGS
ncbi:amidohydrolase [Diaporthe helianthi]|uniref:6-methylsalicylate decarboxylase n=1 Tax=Diaporthe helianthi TaxID=158607 RepID=A0A2P5HS63_DIAHE|nr:amidohydrolase [Diaporthe helianthi]